MKIQIQGDRNQTQCDACKHFDYEPEPTIRAGQENRCQNCGSPPPLTQSPFDTYLGGQGDQCPHCGAASIVGIDGGMDEFAAGCAAFPRGIPEDIWEGRFDHRHQYRDETLLWEIKDDTPRGREMARQVFAALAHSTAKQRWIKVRVETDSEEQYARIANAIKFLLTATDIFDWEVTIDPKSSVTTANDELAEVGDWVPYYPRVDEPASPWYLCPSCGEMKVVRVIVGEPEDDQFEREKRGEVIFWGCVVYGNEPDRPAQCTSCNWCGALDDQWQVIEHDYGLPFAD